VEGERALNGWQAGTRPDPDAGADPDYGIVDVNTQIGSHHGRAAGAPPEDLARERREHGVRLTLARHRTAALGEATFGNSLLLEAAQADPAIVPVATLTVDRSDEYLRRIGAIASKVAAFWLEGRAVPIDSVASENLARTAASTGRPLFIVLGEWADASRIGRATADLGVPVILVGHHYDHSVDNLAAARRYPHLHLETSRMAHLGAIEVAVREIGAERVLYGSGAPFRAMQSGINAIVAAPISDDEKRLILGDNARRLFGLPSSATATTLPAVVRPRRVIDAHTHLGPLPWDAPYVDDRDLMPLLAAQNNAVAAVASSVHALGADTDAGNARTVEVCGAGTGQLGYIAGDPNDVEATRDQIRRFGDKPGIVGTKVHCQWSGRPTGSREIAALFEVFADYGRPVKIHNDGPDWDARLLDLARRHPRLPIIIAHGGLGYPMLEGAALTAAADNIYLEMCSSFAQIPTVRQMLHIMPPHKFLYGTDAPLLDPSFVLGTYQDAHIPADRQDATYHDNAARLFGLA